MGAFGLTVGLTISYRMLNIFLAAMPMLHQLIKLMKRKRASQIIVQDVGQAFAHIWKDLFVKGFSVFGRAFTNIKLYVAILI